MIEHQVYALLLLLLLLMQNEQLFAYEVSLNPAALRDARLVVSIHPVHSFVLHSVLRIFSFFFLFILVILPHTNGRETLKVCS